MIPSNSVTTLKRHLSLPFEKEVDLDPRGEFEEYHSTFNELMVQVQLNS